MTYTSFIDQFMQRFQPAAFVQLARQTRWLIRQRKIDAFEFLLGLVFAQMSALRMTLNAQASCFTEPVTRQGVDQRYHAATVAYVRAAFDHCLAESLAQIPAPTRTAALAAHFSAIYLVDSTAFDCPASLATMYPGCGGDASAANAKLLLNYDYLRGAFEPLALVPGKRSDPGLTDPLRRLAQPNALLIHDKGFFKRDLLRHFQAAQAYFLVPYPRSVSLWSVAAAGQRQALDLAQELQASSAAVVAWDAVQLGQEAEAALSVRLVAYRLSEASAQRHRAALREAQRRQGRQPTAAALELAGWLILLTNAPVDKLPTLALSYLYRIRWQIELIFKQCKSVLRLDVTEAEGNVHRLQCEIWARLIGAVVLFEWHRHLQGVAWLRRRREISFGQVARQFQQHGLSLAQALIAGGQQGLAVLRQLWRQLLHTTHHGRQRTRKTTWENLQLHWLDLQEA